MRIKERLKLMAKLWKLHLDENDMNYWQHLIFASHGAAVCMVHCLRLLIHAVLPCYNRDALRDIHYTSSTMRANRYLARSLKNSGMSEEGKENIEKAFADYTEKECCHKHSKCNII